MLRTSLPSLFPRSTHAHPRPHTHPHSLTFQDSAGLVPIVVALQKLTHKATTGALRDNAQKVVAALLGPSLRSGAFSVSAKVHGCESTLLEFAVQYGLPELTTALIKENADVATKVRLCVCVCVCAPHLTPSRAATPPKAGPKNRKITPATGHFCCWGAVLTNGLNCCPAPILFPSREGGGGLPLFSR